MIHGIVASAGAGAGELVYAVEYDNKSVTVSGQEPFLRGFCFSGDGASMYVTGVNTKRVFRYNLSTPWDISTATYTPGFTFLATAQDEQPFDVYVPNSGGAMYILGNSNNDIYQYSISGFDVSSASFVASYNPAEGSQVYALFFSPDGSRMYTLSYTADRVYQYTLSTPWDISTASYAGVSPAVSLQEANPEGIFLSNNGQKLFVNGQLNGIFQYTMTTPWDVSTAVYDGVVYNPYFQNSAMRDIWFSDNGKKLYTLDQGTGKVYQYSVSPPFNLANAAP